MIIYDLNFKLLRKYLIRTEMNTKQYFVPFSNILTSKHKITLVSWK